MRNQSISERRRLQRAELSKRISFLGLRVQKGFVKFKDLPKQSDGKISANIYTRKKHRKEYPVKTY